MGKINLLSINNRIITNTVPETPPIMLLIERAEAAFGNEKMVWKTTVRAEPKKAIKREARHIL